MFIKHDYKHLQFTKFWAGRRLRGSVVDQLNVGFDGEVHKKGVQFSTLFQVLNMGCSMCDYKPEQYLLRHLKVKNVPKKHWSEMFGREMAKHLHSCVLVALKLVVRNARFVSISVDEVTAVNNTLWIGIHVYVVDEWKRVPHLLHLFYVSNCGTVNHFTNVIMQTLVEEGGLSRKEITCKLVLFGGNRADGVNTFQGPKIGV